MSTYEGIQISSNWDCIKSFEWMVEHCTFIFSKYASGERVYMVLDEPIADNLNCFELGYDRYGVIVNASMTFNNLLGSQIIDSSKQITDYIREYLIRQDAVDLVINS